MQNLQNGYSKIPTMANDEQIFHYSQGLKNRIRLEIERSEIKSLTEAIELQIV